MKIRRSNATWEQVRLANGLKAGLIQLIKRKLRRAATHPDEARKWHRLLRQVELAAQGFLPKFKSYPAVEIDRRTSMLTGPFFTSAEFPIPAGSTGMMIPVVQLELEEMSTAIQEELGDGILQLWYDAAALKDLIRVIPLGKAYDQEPTAFNWVRPAGFNGYPLPDFCDVDPCGDAVQQIVALTSTGVQCQQGYVDACYSDLDQVEEVEKGGWLYTLLKLFGQVAPYCLRGDPIAFFGTFYGIQYSASDVDMKCLVSMDFGSSGGAEIFHKIRKGEATQFQFWSCPR